ncbi:MAG TPA: VOC family protein [Sphingomicrobium sp.]|nr:VOC family protein [Sphingomicrobium sp.]
MGNWHGSHIWYELITPDPDGAKLFYDAVVGWDVESQPSTEGMDYRMIRRSDGNAGGLMRLGDDMARHGARPMWLGYIGVDDLDAALTAVEKDGGTVMMPAFEVEGVGRIAMVTDPQGAPFYLMRPAREMAERKQDSHVFSRDKPQHVRWNELSTTDSDAAVAFYTRHFGWVQDGDMDMGEHGKYRFIHHQGVMIGAIMPKMPEMPVSLWSYYIGVDDIDRAASAVTACGGTILNGPMEIPGGEFALNGMDPQGAAFGLVGPRNR